MSIKVTLKMRGGLKATARYDIKKGQFTVMKGSMIKQSISRSKTFSGANSIQKNRQGVVDDSGMLTRNVVFKSASTAANFVTGNSTNGFIAWKLKDGMPLGTYLKGGK